MPVKFLAVSILLCMQTIDKYDFINKSTIVKEEWNDRFAIAVEDYLHGLISLVNELVRLVPG